MIIEAKILLTIFLMWLSIPIAGLSTGVWDRLGIYKKMQVIYWGGLFLLGIASIWILP